MKRPQRNQSSDSYTPEHPRLNLPPAPLNLDRGEDGRIRVFDPLRRKWIVLTPEEWVRQHFTSYLISSLGYPESLMANEVSLRLNDTSRRCDTVVYNPASLRSAESSPQPLVIVEYKAPDIEITQKVFSQIARYNLVMGAPLLIVSNGLTHYCCILTPEGYRFLPQIPTFAQLSKL